MPSESVAHFFERVLRYPKAMGFIPPKKIQVRDGMDLSESTSLKVYKLKSSEKALPNGSGRSVVVCPAFVVLL